MGNSRDIPNSAVWKGVEIALKLLGSFCPLWVLDGACVSKVSRHHVCCILGHVTSCPHTVSNCQKGGCSDAQIWGVLVASFEHVRAMAMIDAPNLPVVHIETGIMEKKMETTIICRGIYWDNGKENGNYYNI